MNDKSVRSSAKTETQTPIASWFYLVLHGFGTAFARFLPLSSLQLRQTAQQAGEQRIGDRYRSKETLVFILLACVFVALIIATFVFARMP